jgi:hypothetical protein
MDVSDSQTEAVDSENSFIATGEHLSASATVPPSRNPLSWQSSVTDLRIYHLSTDAGVARPSALQALALAVLGDLDLAVTVVVACGDTKVDRARAEPELEGARGNVLGDVDLDLLSGGLLVGHADLETLDVVVPFHYSQ